MKKNTLSAILMTLFLFISCNNSGKDGNTSANSADESVKGPNLTEISKKITESNAVVLAVKEVETLLASIDEVAKKAIGNLIAQNGLNAGANQNGSLLAGAYVISTLIAEKLDGLKNSEELKEKIEDAKKCNKAFTDKLKSSHAELGIANGAASDANAKAAILKTNGTKDKGAQELEKLFESVKNLSKAAQETLNNSVKELTSPVVAENPKKP
uniref:Outer surface protein C n=1 Tax=Borreliella burgdorferi TaxID=139 RepID=Q44705_BORBG|nr:outer surface protein C [Borreliella burgdorferi]